MALKYNTCWRESLVVDRLYGPMLQSYQADGRVIVKHCECAVEPCSGWRVFLPPAGIKQTVSLAGQGLTS